VTREDTGDDRLVVLCQQLADATAAGSAEWRIDAEDTFVWEESPGVVAIKSRDGDGEPPFELTVHNPDGQKLEERVSALVDDDQPAPWNEALADLYRVARRSALHADDVIDALIEAIPRVGARTG
jgi:hypothetical protein